MQTEKILSGVWAFVLSLLTGLGAVLCMVTAFDMQINVTVLVLWLILMALVCSVCYTLTLKLAPPALGALLLGYFWQKGSLEASLEALLNRLTRQYNRAYNWGIIRWGLRTADDMEPTMLLMLCILGTLIVMAVCWSVCRKQSVLPGVLLSLLCVATCFVVTDTVPDIVWLYFLLLGALLLMMTGRVRKQDPVQGNRLCAFLGPVTALALLILLAAVPQQTYHGQAKAEQLTDFFLNIDPLDLLMGQGTNLLSGSDSVDLTTVGYRVESDAEVMTVTAEFDGTLYLRSRAMNTYDGKNWGDSADGTNWGMLGWPNEQLTDGGMVTITTRYAHRMLYMPYYVSTVNIRDSAAGKVNEDQLTEYAFACKQLDPSYLSSHYNVETMWSPTISDWSPDLLTQFITLPDHVQKWAEPLAEEITGGVINVYMRANAIADYVRNSATYDTKTPAMPSYERNFVRWFLEDSDTGYCVHFASTAAVLLQASGIPARYVTGYMVQVTAGQVTPVQAKQAHAWVEYWLPGFGWTVLEATPADLRDQTQPGATTEATNPDNMEQTTPDATEPTGSQSQQQTADFTVLLTVLTVVAGATVIVALLWGQRRVRLWLRSRKYDRASANEQAILGWQEAVLLARLLDETPDPALFALAQKAKYSQYTITETELARFAAYAETAKQKLQKRSVFHRFYYCVILAVY